MIRSVVHPPHIQHIPNMTQQHQQAQPPPPPPLMTPQQINYLPNQQQKSQSTLPQQPHMMQPHNQQNFRSSGQHNHHLQQRMNYAQNRPSFHSGNNVGNIGSTSNSGKSTATAPLIQQQYQFNNVPYNSYKHTYAQQQTEKMNQIQQQQHQQQQQPQQKIPDLPKNLIDTQQQSKISTIQMSQTSEEVLNKENDNSSDKLIIEMNHGCIDEQNNNIATSTLASASKTKTPMCLINELVRSNQLKHQYRVTDEKGPSHEKTYTVVLELGDERYTAQHKTIKGAQHLAAASALQNTNYKQPVNRTARGITTRHSRDKFGATNTITPTVQLNALAMKRGIPTNYSFQYPKSYNELTITNYGNGRNIRRNDVKGNKVRQKFNHNNNNNINNNNNNNNRAILYNHRTTEDDPYKVTVTLGDKQFTGTGLTLQSAKHDAASKALIEMKEEHPNKVAQSDSSEFEAAEAIVNSNGDLVGDNNVDRMKSAISIVQEIAQKRDLPIRFVVESETGPAHMKHFIIKCSVGEIETTGDGNSKKVAKKHAAENMLNELKQLPPLRPTNDFHANNGRRNGRNVKRSNSTNGRQLVQQINPRRKQGGLTKEISPNAISSDVTVEENDSNNPVSRLLRIQQASKKHDPVFSVVEERGQHRRKEFVIEVNCSGLTARGTSNSKKQAKRIAAKTMLVQLGYTECDSLQEISGSDQNACEKARKVTFTEPKTLNEHESTSKVVGGTAGRQLVPGLLLMRSPDNCKKSKNPDQSSISNPATATVARELLDASKSPTAEAITKQSSPVKTQSATNEFISPTKSNDTTPSKVETNNNNNGSETKSTTSPQSGVRAADKLLYLANLFKFEVEFSSFPKGGHNDYLTLISLNSDIAHYFHGSGNSVEAATEQAALSALKTLSEIGLENVNKSREELPKSILTNGKN